MSRVKLMLDVIDDVCNVAESLTKMKKGADLTKFIVKSAPKTQVIWFKSSPKAVFGK